MTNSQKRRQRKEEQQVARVEEVDFMRDVQAGVAAGTPVGKFEARTPERTGCAKRRLRLSSWGSARARRGYVVLRSGHDRLADALGGTDRPRWSNADGTDRFPRGSRAA